MDRSLAHFFFDAPPEADLPPIQQRVRLLAVYALTLVATLSLAFNLAFHPDEGLTWPLAFQLLFAGLLFTALGLFWVTRNLRVARLLAGAAIFVLAAFVLLDNGGSRGVGYLFFLAAFPLLYLFLGLGGGLSFIALFAVGAVLRIGLWPLPADSLVADPDLRSRLVVAFGAASALGAFAVVYQAHLVRSLSRLAYSDSVTGLANRDRLTEDLALTIRDGRPFALVALKLHHFGLVSNHLGMGPGDRVLKVTADRIRAVLPPGSLPGRWNGTFFVLRVPAGTLEDLEALGRRLIEATEKPVDLDAEKLFLQPGVALTRFPEDGPTTDRLVANLSMTLTRGEDQPGQVLCFDEEAWKAEERRYHLAGALEDALARGQFTLAYQPKVRLADGRPHGAELLLRWTHPELGPISPAEFIPVAETLGIIHEITWFVVDQFLVDAVAISDARGPGLDHGPHAINLSSQDLTRRDLATRLISRFHRAGLPPTEVELEITEGVMMSQDPHVRTVLARLKEAGFRLAIDDFGTGYSSLSYLHRIEADALKIDQSFIRRLGEVSAMPPIVDAIVSMGRALGLDVVAEGVETEDQAAYLRDRGCTLAQGWLFGRPMALEDYLAWLRLTRAPGPA